MNEITSSLTLAIDTKAKAMVAQGVDLCNFTVGEPDFETPLNIREAAKRALDLGKTKYGAAAGELKLREAITKKFERDNNLHYRAENIIVSNGGKQTLFNCMLALVQPGDEVLIPAPYWLSYPEMVRVAGATPVIMRTTAATRFKITAEQLDAAINPRTRLLILNSPSNPTGMVYSRDELKALANVIKKHDILVLSDEIYEKLIYEGEHVSIASLDKDIFERTIVSNGFAKAYAMTGWRLGYIAGPVEVVKALTKIQSHSTSNVCTFVQYAGIEALEGPQESLAKMRDVFRGRRDLICKLLNDDSNLSCLLPDGAFYVFVDISKTGMRSVEFCEKFLEKEKVAIAPGAVFGDDQHVRLSYATSNEIIEKGVARLKRFVSG